jgi:hypothetical protein
MSGGSKFAFDFMSISIHPNYLQLIRVKLIDSECVRDGLGAF